MKKLITFIAILFSLLAQAQAPTLNQYGTRTPKLEPYPTSAKSIDVNSGLSVNSTTAGFVPPRMTTTQKLAISSPVAGTLVYDSTIGGYQLFNGTTWVATSGSYNDLSDKPTIPAAQIQADWNQSNNTALDFIKNKPTIPVVEIPNLSQVLTQGGRALDEIIFSDYTIQPSDRSKFREVLAGGSVITITLDDTTWTPADKIEGATFIFRNANNFDDPFKVILTKNPLTAWMVAGYGPINEIEIPAGCIVEITYSQLGAAVVILSAKVDDVLEYNNLASFPATGSSGLIYVAKDTNKTYRWSGSAYVALDEGAVLGETSSTAYRGDRGKAAYDHSQSSGNPHGTTATQVGAYTTSQVDALLAGMVKIIAKNVSNPSITGTTTETIFDSYLVTGGTLSSVNTLQAFYRYRKTGTAGPSTIKIYINTTNSLSGATLIAANITANTNLWILMERTYSLTGGLLYGYPFSSSVISDVTGAPIALSSMSLNPANNFYIIITGQLGNSADTITLDLFKATN